MFKIGMCIMVARLATNCKTDTLTSSNHRSNIVGHSVEHNTPFNEISQRRVWDI